MIPVYFATNRNQIGTEERPRFGDRFHADGAAFYRVGLAQVEEVSDDPDEGYRLNSMLLAPEGHEGDPQALGSSVIFEALRQQMKAERRDVLVYLHGFGSTFEMACCRAAQLSQTYTLSRPDCTFQEPLPFLFSWPSNGQVTPPWQYFDDRHDAEASGLAMARALLRLRDFITSTEACGQRVHLIAHSMGNYALRQAVQGLRRLLGSDDLPCLFDNALLMAADEDDDALESFDKLALLPQLARLIHVYHSAEDRALWVSDRTKLNPARLGVHGPKSFSGLSSRITAIDCELVDETKLTHGNHQYYRLHPDVIRDVRAVLSGLARPARFPWREAVEPGRRYRLGAASATQAA